MNWTDRQKSVIEHRGSDLLVAAAAGSGKTAVLVERIKRLIIEEGVPVDRFLVVTFTRAAASEMKEKIIDALTEAAEADPARSRMFRNQLDRIQRASISTFDSFAIDIVRNYFYIIDIEPNLQMAGEEDVKMMKDEAMEEVFELLYEEGNPEVIAYIDAYSSYKNDRDLKEKLIGYYNSMMSMPEGLGWLEETIASMSDYDEENESTLEKRLRVYLKDIIRRYGEEAEESFKQLKDMFDDHGLEKLSEKLQADIELARAVKNAEPDEIAGLLYKYRFTTMSEKGEGKETFNEIKEDAVPYMDAGKELLRTLSKGYFAEPLSRQFDDLRNTVPALRAMVLILKKFEKAYSEKKLKRGLMDFSDSNHFAIEILKDENVAREIREKYDYIFVDEYQDSNYLQEAIISAIKGPDNLFMVGDIKQSIYGFRMAEPDIFKERYRQYKDEDSDGKKIDLNSNFRSKNSVIESVNDIFVNLMEDYDDDARLYRGDPYTGEINHKSELHILDKPGEEEPILEELKNLRDVEREAILAAGLVKENLGKEIYDSKLEIVRKVEKKDIVILIRNAKNRAEAYYEALTNAGIDAFIDDNSGYFDTIEIASFTDLLKLIDNRRQDIPLLSVLRMPAFDFSVDEMIRIRLEDKDSYYHEAFFDYISEEREGDRDPELAAKVRKVKDFLDEWSYRQTFTPVDRLAWQLMVETGYYDYVGALPAGTRRQANLRNFVSKANAYAGGQWSSLHGLIKYIEAASDKIDSKQATESNEDDDTVRIMTIHKSKGLEFPVVIVGGMGNLIKGETYDRTGLWHKDLGFALQYVNKEKKFTKKTILGKAIIERKNRDKLDEEIRIFYVACTRAKEKLILLGSGGRPEKADNGSYLKMVAPVIDESITGIFLHPINSLKATAMDAAGRDDRVTRMAALDSYAVGNKGEDLDNVLSFTYPYGSDVDRKSKFSVTELNGGDLHRYDLREPSFAAEKKAVSGAALGTVMHRVMERIDFREAIRLLDREGEAGLEEFVKETVDDLVGSNSISREEGEAVRVHQIVSFFMNPVGRRAALADSLEKEKHFTIKHHMEGKDIIVQGVIDCFFEEEDKLVLLDYKTNYNTEGIEELYRGQMMLYKEALAKSTGKEVAEVYLYLMKEGRAVAVE